MGWSYLQWYLSTSAPKICSCPHRKEAFSFRKRVVEWCSSSCSSTSPFMMQMIASLFWRLIMIQPSCPWRVIRLDNLQLGNHLFFKKDFQLINMINMKYWSNIDVHVSLFFRLDAYLKDSRNLKRIDDTQRRHRLLHQGKVDVVAFLNRLPKTTHDPASLVVDVPVVSVIKLIKFKLKKKKLF